MSSRVALTIAHGITNTMDEAMIIREKTYLVVSIYNKIVTLKDTAVLNHGALNENMLSTS